jgi:hypothetical protein
MISPYLRRPTRTLEQALADIAEAKRLADHWRSAEPPVEKDAQVESKQVEKDDTY